MDQIFSFKDDITEDDLKAIEDDQKRVDIIFEKMDSIETIRQNVKKYISEQKKENMKSLEKSKEFREKGNQFFSRKIFEMALKYYNLAVMCAPYPSETNEESGTELSYAFTSRSLTFFEMKAYENSLYDIDCALILSDIWMKFEERLQLMTHKVYCLCRLKCYPLAIGFISTIIDAIPCLPTNNQMVRSLSEMKAAIISQIEMGEQMPSFSESDFDIIEKQLKDVEYYKNPSIDLMSNELKGRHMIATEDIKKGTILSVEKSMVAVMDPLLFKNHCQNCFRNVGYKGWPCFHCSQVVFCNRECAKNAFYHSYECGIAKVLRQFENPFLHVFQMISLVGTKVAIDLVKEPLHNFDFNFDPNKFVNYMKFRDLLNHKNKINQRHRIGFICCSIELAFILDSFEELRPQNSSEEYLKDLSLVLSDLSFRSLINGFGMYETECEKRAFRGPNIGSAVCIETSFYNHSCNPNAIWWFNGNHISVLSNEDIAKDQEICISYGPYKTWPFQKRQDRLMKCYFFQCCCDQCKSDAKSSPSLKCKNCLDGFFPYSAEKTESQCMNCGQTLDISAIVQRVDEIEVEFKYLTEKFKESNSLADLLNVEKCYQNLSEYLFPKSNRMIEINSQLSRSFENIHNYKKAMIYSQNILDSLDDKNCLQYSSEMVFFSRCFYYYLSKERNSDGVLTVDDEWKKCLKTTSDTVTVLKSQREDIIEKLSEKTHKKSELEEMTKLFSLIDGCLKSKERQISIITKIIKKSNPKPKKI